MMADLRVRVEGSVGRITLDRPQALNALTYDMLREMDDVLHAWAENAGIRMVLVDGAGERAFCAGGDIQELYRKGRAGNFDYGRRFWADEYQLNAFIRQYPKPYVALMDGIVMGGGVGVSAHGSHRVVTERSMVAMPECGIGLVPDVGASLILAQAPGRLGEYLAASGARMKAADAIHAGFADSFVPSERLHPLIDALLVDGDPAVIAEFSADPPPSDMARRQAEIDRAFGATDMPAILGRLEEDGSDWARETIAAIRRGSPLSIACALAILRAVREDPSIETALRHEYRFTSRALDKGELLEGIRAAVIDKDRQPRWSPARIEDLPQTRVAEMTAPLGSDELFAQGDAA